jgi:hypothetical protein
VLRILLLEIASPFDCNLQIRSSRRSAHAMLTGGTKPGERPSGSRYGRQPPLAGKVRQSDVCAWWRLHRPHKSLAYSSSAKDRSAQHTCMQPDQ